MLAASMDTDKGQAMESLPYPLIASPKIDGIRCLIIEGKPMSRSLKPIPNRHVTKILSAKHLNGLDGELLVGDGSSFQNVTSGIMSHDGEPEFTFHVFDDFSNPNSRYHSRVAAYEERIRSLCQLNEHVRAIRTTLIRDFEELSDFTEQCLATGYEGAMVRTPAGPYKFGRSTFKEGYLVKIKPFEDAEATVVGFEEQMENTNEKTTNELGRSRRSSHKAGKVPKGTLGALILHNEEFGEFRCGTGLDDALRKEIWNNRKVYFNQTVTFRFQRIGMKDKPRIPAFKGFRHEHDR
jgi:DNA ligase-1